MVRVSDLLKAKLNDHIVIFDGAVGTELYNKNFFVNTCYEYLNITNPDAVSAVHMAYSGVGAEIITTNTYGANRLKLARHGLGEEVRRINQTGVHLARRAGDENNLVAGSVGPIGRERTADLTEADMVAALAEQIVALQDAGADLILGETISSLHDARLFLRAVEEVCTIPYVVSFAVDRELALALGERLEPFIAELEALPKQPTAVGLNCGIGPEPMLAALEKLVKVCNYPIVARPNAGLPKLVDNRTIYMCSPEYLCTYAIRFVSLGVRGVGGCCGTTPEHIGDLARCVRPISYTPRVVAVKQHAEQPEELPEVPIAERSALAAALAKGEFVKTVEITPPRGFDLAATIAKSAQCQKAGFHAINLPDGPRASSRISSMITAEAIQREAGIEAILHVCCRDKNLIAMQADMLGCAQIGVNNILFITGDPPKLGDYPFASGVFDVDAIGILKVATGLNRGLDIGRHPIGGATRFFAGAGVDPSALDMKREISRMREKAAAGAKFFITQPVFSVESLEVVLAIAAELGVPVIAGVWPLASYRNAEFMQNEVPGVVIPESVMRRMAAGETKQHQHDTGVEIARETIEQIKNKVAGVQVAAPFGRVETSIAVLEGF